MRVHQEIGQTKNALKKNYNHYSALSQLQAALAIIILEASAEQ